MAAYGTNRYKCTDLPDAFFRLKKRRKTNIRPRLELRLLYTNRNTTECSDEISSSSNTFTRKPSNQARKIFQDDLFSYNQDLSINTFEDIYNIARLDKLTLKPSKTLLNCRRMQVLRHILTS